MPIYTYTCEKGEKTELLYYPWDGPLPDDLKCSGCGKTATRDECYPVSVIGPVFEHLEDANRNLLTPKQRASGMELRTAKQIHEYEESQGIYRPEASVARVQREEQQHDSETITRIRKDSGSEAAADHIAETEIMNATGWDQNTTRRWKEQSNAAEQAVRDGRVDPESHGTLSSGSGDFARDAGDTP